MPGRNNYLPGRSILFGGLDRAQELLNQYAGTGEFITPNKERVDFHQVIGRFKSPKLPNDSGLDTTIGIINYGSDGAHIVPATPPEASRDKSAEDVQRMREKQEYGKEEQGAS